MHNGGKENGNVVFARIVNYSHCVKMIHNSTKYDIAILLPTVMDSPTVADYPACVLSDQTNVSLATTAAITNRFQLNN